MVRWLGVVAVVVTAPAVAWADGFRDSEAMNEMLLRSGSEHVHATSGSGCISEDNPDGTGTAQCVDTRADLPLEGRLELVGGEPLRFELDHAAVELTARIGDAELAPEPAGGGLPATVWEAEVPGDLRGDNRLEALATYDPNGNPRGDRAFQAGVSGPGPDRAPKAAIAAARAEARERLGGRVKVTFSIRSERDRRWALVDGVRRKRLWAAWVRRGDEGRWRVRRFRTRRFDPRGVPCDTRPAFSEPAC